MKKQFSLRALSIMLALFASVTSVFAQSVTKRTFDVSEYGHSIATVALERNNEVLKAFIYREGQPVHLYGSFPAASAWSVYIGKEKVLAYYGTTSRVETKTSGFTASAAARHGRKDVDDIHEQLADDMRILRAVRVFDHGISMFESNFVIATGDESIFQNEPAASLQVKERPHEGTTSAGIFSAQLIKVGLNGRRCSTRQGLSPGTIGYCYQQCGNNRDMCIHDPKVGDHTACYTGYTSCTGTCETSYGPKPVLPEGSSVQ